MVRLAGSSPWSTGPARPFGLELIAAGLFRYWTDGFAEAEGTLLVTVSETLLPVEDRCSFTEWTAEYRFAAVHTSNNRGQLLEPVSGD